MVIGGQYNSFSGNSYKMESQGMLNILMWREYVLMYHINSFHGSINNCNIYN